LVSTESAHAFGVPLPVWPADHFRQLNWLVNGKAHYIGPLPLELYAQVIAHLASLGFGRDGSEETGRTALSAGGPSMEGSVILTG
jgi:triacylglycerol lipase